VRSLWACGHNQAMARLQPSERLPGVLESITSGVAGAVEQQNIRR